jgi:hypothetical protein
MSDQPTETTPEVAEPQALPAPVISQPSEPAPSAAPDLSEQLTRLKTDLLTELKTYVDRSSQSVKDRRIVGLERKIEELSAAKIVLAAHGGDVAKAAREAAIDEILGGRESPANQGKVGEDWDADVQKILLDAEQTAGVKVPLNDPELRAAVTRPDGTPKEFSSYSDALSAVNRVVLRRARGTPAAITEIAGAPATPPNVDALTNNLQALIASGAPTVAIVAARDELLKAMKS